MLKELKLTLVLAVPFVLQSIVSPYSVMSTRAQNQSSSSPGLARLRSKRNALRKTRAGKIAKTRTKQRIRPEQVKRASKFIDSEATHAGDEKTSDIEDSEREHPMPADDSSFIDDSQQPSDGEHGYLHASGLIPNVNVRSRLPSPKQDGPIVVMESELDSDSAAELESNNTKESIRSESVNSREYGSNRDEYGNGKCSQVVYTSSASEESSTDKDNEYDAAQAGMDLEPENEMDNRMVQCTSPENQNSLLESIQARLASRLVPRKQAVLVRRNPRKVPRARKRTFERSDAFLPYADAWALTLTKYERSFWCSDEARLGNTDRFIKASMGYKAVSIHERNNKDMELVYELSVKPKEDTGKEVKWFTQFKLAVGQFVRMCVSTQAINRNSLETLCERGSLFKLTAIKSVGQIFVDYFKIRGTVTTVMNKSRLLKKLCDFALDYGENRFDSATISSIREMARLLNNTANAHKAMYKSEARSNQRADLHAEEGGWLEPEDFRLIVSKCQAQLQGIVDNFREVRREAGGKLEFFEFCKGNERLIQKYNVNFTTYLVLAAGGQRPQVYASLLHPSFTELDDMKKSCTTENLFTMRTDHEKKLRPSDAPYVGFRADCFKYVEFFVKHVRPAILRTISHNIRSGRELVSVGRCRASGIADQFTIDNPDYHIVKDPRTLDAYIERLCNLVGAPLIIHTRNGKALTTSQVTRTVQQCIGVIDPELSTISVMKIRCAFATNAILEHKEAVEQETTNMCADEYLANLAKTMNTSVDMLKNIYITIEPGMIMHSLRNVFSVFQNR